MTERERHEVEKFSCKFHGDFNLKTHPGTYEEAIKVYKELPSLLGEHYEHSVPVKVGWLFLYPGTHFFYRQLDFSSEPRVANEILENEPKSCLTVA